MVVILLAWELADSVLQLLLSIELFGRAVPASS
jgi:hypothetical protein